MFKISIDAINTIDLKLGQADAIATLLICDCDCCAQINNELRSFVLGTISDLISDSKKLLRKEIEREGCSQ